MERLLIVNADDFGLSKGQNYGIIEACRNGIVTSTTALVNGQAIDHAVQLSRDEPSLAIGMHFVLTMGKPLTAMPGLPAMVCWESGSGSWQKKMLYRWKKLLRSSPVSICVSLSYLDANLRILIAIIMCICSRRFSRLWQSLWLKRGLRCASTVNRYLTMVIYRLICAVRRDSVARFMVKRLARHCSCKCLMIPAIVGNARWKLCAIRRLSIIRFARVLIASLG